MSSDYGVKQVADKLYDKLRSYIEAQYHISSTNLIDERSALLRESGSIGQDPYIETTPSYDFGAPYIELSIPAEVKETFLQFSKWGVGLFPRPYVHQAIALESFFNSSEDLVVATGTGSGKTETFLMPILGSLISEGVRKHSFKNFGARALVLYPMNALVSDQVSRLRRLFGDVRVADHFRKQYGRIPRFGMYTSRTPYPGARNSEKDRKHVAPLLEYYCDLESPDPELPEEERELRQELCRELKARGRWPAKDLTKFFGKKKEHWDKRLKTQDGDRELMVRHEIQQQCPDILVTNYSMLEYMLVRPIERPIFEQTKLWFRADPNNSFLIVLDEAHMYRGVGGAEVALLLRRLLSRLEIPRERCRFILTSASLGRGAESIEALKDFANKLTGATHKVSFTVIRGTPEQRPDAAPATQEQGICLSEVSLDNFFKHSTDLQVSIAAVKKLAHDLNWGSLDGIETREELQAFLYKALFGFPPAELLIQQTSGNALLFTNLAQILFPALDAESAVAATSSLLALGTFAHNGERALFPSRIHLLFRGLPTLYACCNPRCDARRVHKEAETGLGRLYTEPLTRCKCSDKARIFELFTHRDCGTAYLRVYGRGPRASFYWHEQGGDVGEESLPLDESFLLTEDFHPDMAKEVEPIFLDVRTGRVFESSPDNSRRYVLVYRPRTPATTDRNGRKKYEFSKCPVCKKNMGQKLMDLATKGEQPFAALTGEQLFLQPAMRSECRDYPNGGRKVLLFSDGRQKAARLARDLPREIERDSFRHVILLVATKLKEVSYQASLDANLYTSFLWACSRFNLIFFDHVNRSQEKLLEDIRKFDKFYGSDLRVALDDDPVTPPPRFQQAILRQLSDPFYSLYSICAAYVQPRPNKRTQISAQLKGFPQKFLENDLDYVVEHWIQDVLELAAFDPSISEETRRLVNQYYIPFTSDKQTLTEKVCRESSGLSKSQCDLLFSSIRDVLTEQVESGVFLKPQSLVLSVAIDSAWYRCNRCKIVQHTRLFGNCASCQSPDVEELSPSHPYMVSRKGYFRAPIREVLNGAPPKHITAEEHTAQLSHRDSSVTHATTEEYELRFQDVPISNKPPVDVLSCTTTMEVGIDIGSLTAVGMRNVPPQRENYQQRSGRAGRRGSAISTVITYAQGGPHDNYYYQNPSAIISGEPRQPRIQTNNRRLAIRHVQASLVQRFFHETIDSLPLEQRRAIETSRTGLMSALGSAHEFFTGTDQFTFSAFCNWATQNRDKVTKTTAMWLPSEVFLASEKKEAFTAEILGAFIDQLNSIGSKWSKETLKPSESGRELLEVLFDEGLLPSYAFPTDLCTFYVFDSEEEGRIKEKPQQDKAKALSEYAPGRLLVVDKQTYRVGGIFDENGDYRTPGQSLFSKPLSPYVYCPMCTYVREEPLTAEGEVCPVCESELAPQREMLDPPGFSPEGGMPVAETDKDQEFSYATNAQLPTPIDQDTFDWQQGAGVHLKHAYGENRQLVVVNKGPDETGFVICETCGATAPGTDGLTSPHLRPYRWPDWVQKKLNIHRKCNGPLHQQVYLGFSFRTDLLLLRCNLKGSMVNDPRNRWYLDALLTTSEALALGASRYLDIDPGEISANCRMMPSDTTENQIDFYLYDTAAGGAGYAAEAGGSIAEVLRSTIDILEKCDCESSCTKCLRHYGNRYLHYRLDRHLAANLLRYGVSGELPEIESVDKQAERLAPLKNFLEFEGWSATVRTSVDGVQIPLLVKRGNDTVALGTFPALLDKNSEEFSHPLHALDRIDSIQAVLLNDYIASRDLPTGFQRILIETGMMR